jgi:hypothetical protein
MSSLRSRGQSPSKGRPFPAQHTALPSHLLRGRPPSLPSSFSSLLSLRRLLPRDIIFMLLRMLCQGGQHGVNTNAMTGPGRTEQDGLAHGEDESLGSAPLLTLISFAVTAPTPDPSSPPRLGSVGEKRFQPFPALSRFPFIPQSHRVSPAAHPPHERGLRLGRPRASCGGSLDRVFFRAPVLIIWLRPSCLARVGAGRWLRGCCLLLDGLVPEQRLRGALADRLHGHVGAVWVHGRCRSAEQISARCAGRHASMRSDALASLGAAHARAATATPQTCCPAKATSQAIARVWRRCPTKDKMPRPASAPNPLSSGTPHPTPHTKHSDQKVRGGR